MAVKLKIFSTVLESLKLPFIYSDVMFRVSWFPIFAYIVIKVAQVLIPGVVGVTTLGSPVGSFIYGLVFDFILVMVTVPAFTAWHRAHIFPERSRYRRPRYSIGDTEVNYAKFVLLFYLGYAVILFFLKIVLPVFVPSLARTGILTVNLDFTGVYLIISVVFFSVLFIYILLRLSLVFPAAASGVRFSLSRSWRVTRRNGVRFLVAAIILAVVGLVLFIIVLICMGLISGPIASYIFGAFINHGYGFQYAGIAAGLVLGFFFLPVYLYFTTIQVSLISVGFKQIYVAPTLARKRAAAAMA